MTTSNEPQSALPGINAARVTEWIEGHVAGSRPPFGFELIPAGHSNITFKVTDARGERYVLRRPPLGAVLATAHDMGREFKIISALGPTRVPVPPALGLCTDEAVNGAPFYVMGFVDGHVLVETADSERHFSAAERRSIAESLIQVLADLHAVDPDAVGLGDLGKKEAYIARQIKRWRKQWEGSKTRELEAMETVALALEATCRSRSAPPSFTATSGSATASPAPTRASRRCSTGSSARWATRWPTWATSSTTGWSPARRRSDR